MTATAPLLFFLCLNDRGGAELSMLRVAHGLRQRGRDVTLAVYGATPALAAELGFDGLIVDLQCRRTSMAVIKLAAHLRRRSYGTVISALTHTNLAALLALRLSRHWAKPIVSEHGLDGVECVRQSDLFRFITARLYARAVVVAVSDALAQQWRDVLPATCRITTIYNPVVDESARATPIAAVHPWLVDRALPVVMGIGRLKPEKNFALLLRAFARAAAQRPLRLIILGDGEQRDLLERLAHELGIDDRVTMPGFVTDPRVWLASAAMLVCPSQREGFGNVLVEAMAEGVPVVATDCPCGPAEILGQGTFGRLVPMEDEGAMAQAIAATLDNPVPAERLRRRSRDFTVNRCLDGYAALIDNDTTG